MIEIGWGTVVSLVAVVGAVGPGFYLIGGLAKQVARNERDIKTIYGKVDEIHSFVKNGR